MSVCVCMIKCKSTLCVCKNFRQLFLLGRSSDGVFEHICGRERESVCERERGFVSECAFVKSKVGAQDV